MTSRATNFHSIPRPENVASKQRRDSSVGIVTAIFGFRCVTVLMQKEWMVRCRTDAFERGGAWGRWFVRLRMAALGNDDRPCDKHCQAALPVEGHSFSSADAHLLPRPQPFEMAVEMIDLVDEPRRLFLHVRGVPDSIRIDVCRQSPLPQT